MELPDTDDWVGEEETFSSFHLDTAEISEYSQYREMLPRSSIFGEFLYFFVNGGWGGDVEHFEWGRVVEEMKYFYFGEKGRD